MTESVWLVHCRLITSRLTSTTACLLSPAYFAKRHACVTKIARTKLKSCVLSRTVVSFRMPGPVDALQAAADKQLILDGRYRASVLTFATWCPLILNACS